MIVNKLRVSIDEDGLVPAGEYFKRLAAALRDANDRQEIAARGAPTAIRSRGSNAQRTIGRAPHHAAA